MSDIEEMVRIPVTVGIIAGGKSSRMGRNKALLKLENETIIRRTVKELGGFSEVLISAAKKGEYESLGTGMVYDEHTDIGPIEGIYQVLKAAKSDYVFICAADMPFVKKELVDYLIQFISGDYDCIVIADEEHIHPLCAIYSKRALPALEEMIEAGEYRIRRLFKRVNTKFVSLGLSCFDKKVVKNVNTRAEYAEALRPLIFCVSGYSDSGKTGLICRLINEFKKEGLCCAAIKHDGHDSFTDMRGSDTELFTRSGAVCTTVFSDSRFMTHSIRKTTVEEHIKRLKGADVPPDVIIIEGMKRSAYPKVELVRRVIHPKSECDPETLICVASDCISQDEMSVKVLELNDTRGIFDCIIDYFDVRDVLIGQNICENETDKNN
ncbi:MAG: molybdopterin-guanine dinucleotide biosynthesis protein B [Lachnospiraceae bacterium]|nr:molybdopterin-guanine dinucleotide biosynthesis protein B [Lachnospiraceae bacterium]